MPPPPLLPRPCVPECDTRLLTLHDDWFLFLFFVWYWGSISGLACQAGAAGLGSVCGPGGFFDVYYIAIDGVESGGGELRKCGGCVHLKTRQSCTGTTSDTHRTQRVDLSKWVSQGSARGRERGARVG